MFIAIGLFFEKKNEENNFSTSLKNIPNHIFFWQFISRKLANQINSLFYFRSIKREENIE